MPSARFAIRVESLSKRYRIEHPQALALRYNTLRDAIASRFSAAKTKEPREPAEVWALRDVSVEVNEGEAIGLIGPNGAGKSTLLKVLSGVTEPTSGRALLRGRVASLLEVGTGFHPELSGRENIFLNGTILGMKRVEIRERFDDIVQFAEVEKFLDTPVKRYSSGMYVRLAFAVAAHLTPEILLIDEVLAVGDHDFQKKCLGRMGEVARSGRTVVFVSHNLASIENLCERSILLRRGRIEMIDDSHRVIAAYLSARQGESAWDLGGIVDREGTGRARITRMELLDGRGDSLIETVEFLKPFLVRIHYEAFETIDGPTFGLCVLSEKGERVFLTHTPESNLRLKEISGRGHIDCSVLSPNLLPGRYRFEAWITDVYLVSFADHVWPVGSMEIIVGDWRGGGLAGLTFHDRGKVFMNCAWQGPFAMKEQ